MNNTEAPDIINHNLFTGLVEISAYKETLELVLKLHPETRKVIIIIDNTPSGKHHWQLFEKLLDDPDFKEIEFSRIDDSLHVSGIEETLSRLSDDTIVLFGTYFRDKSGAYFPLGEAASRFSKASSRPMYGFHAEYLPYGLVGGKLLGGVYHGRKAAEIALRILNGEKVKDIPVITETTAQYMFNFDELVRFGISPSDLPKDKLIINEPYSFYEEYKSLVWATISIMISLVAIISILQVNIIKRKRSEQALRDSEARYRSLFDGVPVGLYRTTPSGQILDANPALVQMLGYPDRQALMAIKAPDLYVDPEDRKHEQVLLEREGVVHDFQMQVRQRDGTAIWVADNARAVRDAKGRVLYYKGSLEDITERKQAEEQLRYQSYLLQSVSDAIISTDVNFNIKSWNKAAEITYGWQADEVIGKQMVDVTKMEYAPDQREKLVKELFEKGHWKGEVIQKRRDGIPLHILASVSLLRDSAGNPTGAVAVNRDITERKRAECEIEARRMYLEGVLGAAPDAIITLDARHRIVEWNSGAERLFGHSRQEVIGRNLDHVVTNPDTFEDAVRFTQMVMSGREVPPTETVRYRKDGTPVDVIVAGSPILVGDELIGVVAVYTDITERKRAEQQLAHMASHDPLTSLPNRMLFNDRLNLALAHAHRSHQKLALMLLDLDHFKDVNDALGHSVGDKLLQAVGERLTSLLRKSDTVARMGGDEFTLILPETARVEDAARIAQKILDAFRKPFVFDGHKLDITTSIGIALYPTDGEDADTLMRSADIAMDRAKEEGRDNYQSYTPAMNAKALE